MRTAARLAWAHAACGDPLLVWRSRILPNTPRPLLLSSRRRRSDRTERLPQRRERCARLCGRRRGSCDAASAAVLACCAALRRTRALGAASDRTLSTRPSTCLPPVPPHRQPTAPHRRRVAGWGLRGRLRAPRGTGASALQAQRGLRGPLAPRADRPTCCAARGACEGYRAAESPRALTHAGRGADPTRATASSE